MLSSNPNNKNSFHRRNDSGELDVFEAARYFSSSGNDQNPGNNVLIINGVSEKQNYFQRSTGRMSLDLPTLNSNPTSHDHHNQPGLVDQKAMMKEKTKYKQQPSSPGGRLASFLNSLFNQAHLRKKTMTKKKKSKSVGPTSKDFEDESPGGRRKRRSSISHFSTRHHHLVAEDKISAGFRTPPPYADTPIKSYKEFRNLSDHQRQAISLPEKTISRNGKLGFDQDHQLIIKDHRDLRKLISDADYDDDGADSDSSSDLFDLPNHELDFYCSDLPVYETTHVDRIKIAKPISRATTV